MQIDTTRLVHETTARATKVTERLAQVFPSWTLHPTGRIGSPQWALIDEAKKIGAELMILGSKGHSLVNRILFGSVSHSVVNHAPCSVRVARFHKDPHTGPVRIMVGIDGSPSANAALQFIVRREWPADTEVCAVTVYDEDVLPLSAFESRYTEESITAAMEESKAALEEALRVAGETLASAGLKVTTAFRPGAPRDTLMNEVDNFKAETLFLGSKGHSLIDRLLIGSTSSSLAAQAPCSVEIIR